MRTLLDLHTHTLVSGHAFSTIQEMVNRAAAIGLPYLGITDHGPAIPGAPPPIYFHNLYCVPRRIDGVRLLMGAELNIMDYEGNLDLDASYYDRLDHVIAGIHRLCYTAGTVEQNTNAVLGAMHNPRVNIISHPADGAAQLELEPLVRASRDTQTLLEVNNSSLNPVRHNCVARPNNLELLRLCRRYDVPVILGSDAHMAYAIADYSQLWPLIAETGFPKELIVNANVWLFESFTGLRLPKE
ncbi:MAG: phosphatase [Clostridium sp.]|nr:phosphatase [Clostridium sp.]